MLRTVFALRSRVCPKAIHSGPRIVATVVAGLLLLALILPRPVAGQNVEAVLFFAHPSSGQEATAADPVPVSGGRATFELRVRAAGDVAKAGWQTLLLADACEFEQPSQGDVELGDMFRLAVPVLQIQPIQENQIRVKLGQVLLAGNTTQGSGRLATIHLTRKATRNCPSGGAGAVSGVSELTLAASPATQWSAPGGVKLAFATVPGYIAARTSAVEVTEVAAESDRSPVPLLGLGILAVLAVAAVLFSLRRRGVRVTH